MGWVVAVAAIIAAGVLLRYSIRLSRQLACVTYCWTNLSDWTLLELTRFAQTLEAEQMAREGWQVTIEQHLKVMSHLGVWRPIAVEMRQFDILLGEKYNLGSVDPH